MRNNPASQGTSKSWRFFNSLEENFIAICLGLMTLITFANVVARYVYNSNILWALEMTSFLFAWLILIGVSYGVKNHFHIGVDVVINKLPPSGRKACALFSVAACLSFAFMLLVGAWLYWSPFIDPGEDGQGWYEVEEVPMPDFLQFVANWTNAGEQYEKMPRFIPYFALPLGMLLLTYRFLQQAWYILHNRVDTLIAGHEAEEELFNDKIDLLDGEGAQS